MTTPTATDNASPQEVSQFHRQSDVNSSPLAQHHTLGIQPNQASPGDHTHDGKDSRLLDQNDEGIPTHGHDGLYSPVGHSHPAGAHDHNDRYYTETESDARYALMSHSHVGTGSGMSILATADIVSGTFNVGQTYITRSFTVPTSGLFKITVVNRIEYTGQTLAVDNQSSRTLLPYRDPSYYGYQGTPGQGVTVTLTNNGSTSATFSTGSSATLIVEG